jgi:hypothetical protein
VQHSLTIFPNQRSCRDYAGKACAGVEQGLGEFGNATGSQPQSMFFTKEGPMRLFDVVTNMMLLTVTAYGQTPTESQHLWLEDGTPLRLRLQRTISSADANVNDQVDFDVLDEVKVNGTIVIPKGSTAWGTVTAAQSKRRLGRGGKLDMNIDSVRLFNGEKVALRAVKNSAGGGHAGVMAGGIVATAIFVPVAAPLFLLMHGKDVTIPKGTEITAYVNGNVDVSPTKRDAARTEPPTLASASVTGPLIPESRMPSADPSTVVIKSNPEGSEILVDGKFVGSTPSTLQLSPGEHAFTIQQAGFKVWSRNVSINAGSIINLNAPMEKEQ